MKTETLSFLERIKLLYTIACGNPEPEGQEADALMTESDKMDKYGPVVKTFKSESNPNRDPYEVRWKKGNSDPTCTCKGWINCKTTPKKCKHTTEVKNQGLKTVAALARKYKVSASKEFTYETSIDFWRKGDKIFAFLGGKDVDVTNVFKGLDTSWLTEKEISPDVTFTYYITPAGQMGSYWQPEEPAEINDISCELKHGNLKLDISEIMEVKLPDGKDYTYHMLDTLFDAVPEQDEGREDY